MASADSSPFNRPIENGYGGESLLTNVNGPESQRTTIPQNWADKERAVSIIGEIIRRHGNGEPVVHGMEKWSAEDRVRDLGGLTPDKQVIVSGMALGPAGQWLAFSFQDLAKDANAPTLTGSGRPNEHVGR